jgi:hypothetical protein
MRRLVLVAAGWAAFCLAGPAAAQNVQPWEPNTVVAALQRAGLPADLGVDENAPVISSAYEGTNFKVYLLNCTDKADCRSVQFFSGYSGTGATLTTINEWNKTKRFARAYLDEEGTAWLEMDIDMDPDGISPPLFQHNVEYWLGLIAVFEEHIGY